MVLTDDFNDNSLDTSKWDEYEYLGATVAEQNQRLECLMTSEFQACGISSKEKIDCRNIDITVRIGRIGTPAGWALILCPIKTYTQNIFDVRPHYAIQYSMGQGVQALKFGQSDTERKVLVTEGVEFQDGMRLRIFSAEDMIRFYYEKGSGWKEIYSEPYSDVDYDCYVYIVGGSSPSNIGSCWFDDFQAVEAISPMGQVSSMITNITTNYVVPAITLYVTSTLLLSVVRALRE